MGDPWRALVIGRAPSGTYHRLVTTSTSLSNIAPLAAQPHPGASTSRFAPLATPQFDEWFWSELTAMAGEVAAAVGGTFRGLVLGGGYGRGELSPLSDVDVMFLFPTKTKPADAKPLQQHLTDEILYILWDCGLKVGHSTRTIDEAFIEARREIQTKTALLEARRIAGSEKLYDTFSQAYRSYYISEDPKRYIAERLADQTNRRSKYGNTVFNQEPEIKNGVGGLRDYQNAVWMARV